MKRRFLSLLVVLTMAIVLTGCRGERLTIVTTTSLENSGLLEEILPHFEAEYGIRTRVVAVGTGAALEMGRLGQADILLVHDESLEQKFMDEGYGALRKTFMYNDFLLAGPEVLAVASLEEALGKIHEGLLFYSRGDDSATHARERRLWETYGYEIDGFGSWYKETGQGMGPTLNMAAVSAGYTLTDRATYLSMRENLDIGIAYENPDAMDLMNPYSVIKVSAAIRGDSGEKASTFYAWITSPATVELIGRFRVDGEQLFKPWED